MKTHYYIILLPVTFPVISEPAKKAAKAKPAMDIGWAEVKSKNFIKVGRDNLIICDHLFGPIDREEKKSVYCLRGKYALQLGSLKDFKKSIKDKKFSKRAIISFIAKWFKGIDHKKQRPWY